MRVRFGAPLRSGQTSTSPRQTVLVSANALVAGDWKVLTGKVIEANWGGPQYPNASTATDPIENYNMQCGQVGSFVGGPHAPLHAHGCGPQGCLFNVAEDPAERNNLASQNPEKLAELLQQLAVESKTIWDNPPGRVAAAAGQWARGQTAIEWLIIACLRDTRVQGMPTRCATSWPRSGTMDFWAPIWKSTLEKCEDLGTRQRGPAAQDASALTSWPLHPASYRELHCCSRIKSNRAEL
jgi:hypothetical protein